MHPTPCPSGQSLWTKHSKAPSAPTWQEPASKPFTWDAVSTGAREPGQQQQEQQVDQREGVEAGQASCGERRQLARPHRRAATPQTSPLIVPITPPSTTPQISPDHPQHHPRTSSPPVVPSPLGVTARITLTPCPWHCPPSLPPDTAPHHLSSPTWMPAPCGQSNPANL